MADSNKPTQIETDDARAGESKGSMRYVLGISLVLIIVVFAFLILR